MSRLAIVCFAIVSFASHGSCNDKLDASTPLGYAETLAREGFGELKIVNRQIKRVARILDESKFVIKAGRWDRPPYPPRGLSFEETFAYFLMLDAINYMYVDPKTKLVFSDGGGSTGAALLAERLTAHFDDLYLPGNLANLNVKKAGRIFEAVQPLPELGFRVVHLQQVGDFLERHRGVKLRKWLKQFKSGLELARALAKDMPGFEEPFLKRAQLFVGMLNGRYEGTKELPKGVRNLTGMTVYADYILPMVFARMGILDYDESLFERIQSEKTVPRNSRIELEIRAATLIAADRLYDELHAKPRYAKMTILDLDAALWLQGKEIVFEGSEMPAKVFRRPEIKHHLTDTTFY